MRSRFVRPDTTRLFLADVARRAHESSLAAHTALLARGKPDATPDEIAISKQRVASAAQRAADTKEEGAWIEVKRRLNAGEQRAAHARMYLAGVDGTLRVDLLQTGLAQITAYLIDWSLKDDDGHPVVIRGLSVEALSAALDALDPESFSEIRDAIGAHEESMAKERAAEKQIPFGESASSATSPSLVASDGATSG